MNNHPDSKQNPQFCFRLFSFLSISMGSKWQKAKLALGQNLCLYVPKTRENSSSTSRRSNDAVSRSPKTCAICLTEMKAGEGNAIFTAECSHSFHFHCITTNVNHGNQICPICRTKWNQIPKSSRSISEQRNDAASLIIQRPPSIIPKPIFENEPRVFDDDEPLQIQNLSTGVTKKLEVKTYPEISQVARSASFKDFAVLINLKAPSASESSSSRAPVDLVTVLDVSGSMSGTKFQLLKRAMRFVIQNLGPFDRLSVISFSSKAYRNFPLRLMTETGKQEALQAVNMLVADGGTNIAAGLKKGASVLIDRRFKNPVSSIVLLSDGQDPYTWSVITNDGSSCMDYKPLLPKEIINGCGQIPVHTFGFGTDHDPFLMHSIAEISGGTFSFIESENVIQDAFAQCIGGLLNVVVQELCVKIETVDPIKSVKAGSYCVSNGDDSRTASIGVGDLYAEEERNFLVNLDIPIVERVWNSNPVSLLKVQCVYRDPVTNETVDLDVSSSEVKILRPISLAKGRPVVSIEVDRQKIRLLAAEAISHARVLAEQWCFTEAASVLETCRKMLMDSVSGRAGDQLCMSLCAELSETQERMASRQVYEARGRAYVLAGLSSHSWQRATARGDMDDSTTSSYQTQTMVDMVDLSHTMTFEEPALATSTSNSTYHLH